MEKTTCKRAWRLPIFLFGLLLLASALAAWNTTGGAKLEGKLVINGKENASDSVYYIVPMDYGENASYLEKGHAYILEHAIELLRSDGYENWADVAQANLLHLNCGSSHADAYKGRIELYLQVEILWGIVSWDIFVSDLTCVGGCEHYYDPSTGKGLYLAGWMDALDFVRFMVKLLSTYGLRNYTYGLLNIDIEIHPDLQDQYSSGIELCQEHYDRAVGTWNKGDYLYPYHSSWESAMYELGWACHNMADLTVVQHLHNEFFGSHGGYEDKGDGHGDENGEPIEGSDQNEEDYHADNARDAYHFSQNYTPSELAEELVSIVNNLPGHKEKADEDETRLEALKEAIPLAEQYTAALLAQFMTEVGVPKKTPPLEGYVRISGGLGPLAGAYVFYGLSSVSPIEQNIDLATADLSKGWKGWSHVRTDANGHYRITVKANYRYWLRPAMPGYRWQGTTGSNLEFGKKESFVTYTPQSGMTSSDSISFNLTQMPKVAALAALAAVPIVHQAAIRPRNGRVRWEFTASRLIKPNAKLVHAAAPVSAALSGTIQQSLMKTASDESVLQVQNGNINLPEETLVTVALSDLIDVVEAKTLTSAAAILDTIDLTRVARRSAIAKAEVSQSVLASSAFSQQKVAAAQSLSLQQWQAVKAKLPNRQMTLRGKKRNVYILSANAEGSEGASLLLQNGLVAIPSRAGAKIEVSAVSGTGLLTGVKPLTLTTNSEGRAGFYVRSGSHAGKLRLNFKVVKNPAAVQVLPSDNVDIMVHPPLRGFDPAVETVPVLKPAVMEMFLVKRFEPPPSKMVAAVTLPLQPERPRVPPGEPLKREGSPPAGPGERRSENFDRDPVRGWEFREGARPIAGEAGRVLGCRGAGHGAWLIEPLCDFELNFRYRPGNGAGEVLFRMGGEPPRHRHYALRLSGREILLARRLDGEEKPLCRGAFAFSSGRWASVVILSQGRKITVLVDGKEALGCRDPEPLPPGNIAFGCREGEGIAFDDVQLTPLEMPEGEKREPGPTGESQPGEMEPPPPPEPQVREIELPPPPEPQPQPPTPPESRPQEPQPPVPPKPQPPPQPQPPRPPQPQPQPPPQQPSSQAAPVDISGAWRSSRDFNYRISQQGSQFTWEAPQAAERGSGTISGRSVNASWTGRMGSGTAHGTVEVGADGRATAIRWDNGVVFRKQN